MAAGRRSICVRRPVPLLDSPRAGPGPTGDKPGRQSGACGASTVLVDGLPQQARPTLRIEAPGNASATVDGLRGTAIERAFVECGAFQRAHRTSGFLMVCAASCAAIPTPTEPASSSGVGVALSATR